MSNSTEFETMLREWIIKDSETPSSLSEMEQTIRILLQRIGGLLLSLWIMWVSRGYREPSVQCPEWGHQADYVRQREACLHTMFGRVTYKRALYQCRSCGEWHSALDEALGLRPNAMSAELEHLVAQLGVHMPFAQASTLFKELTLVGVSDQSVDKATQADGEAVCEVEQEQLKDAQSGTKPSIPPCVCTAVSTVVESEPVRLKAKTKRGAR